MNYPSRLKAEGFAGALRMFFLSMLIPAYASAEPLLLQQALNGPMKGVDEIIFVNRLPYNDGHWYANIGYYCDDEKPAYAGNGRPDIGRLCKIDLRTKKMTIILNAGPGSVRDPIVHYNGRKALFSWRKANTACYNLYELELEGSLPVAADSPRLRQITFGPFDDYEPAYLPDDDIVFVSTRCMRWVNCWKTQVGNLHRCGPNGDNIREISSNNEHDNTPAVLPDGRIIFTRWEYVDRSQMGYHHLWVMNPDGTGQMVYYGNQQHYPLFIDARPVPGSDDVIGVDSPGHGRNDHKGYITEFTAKFGPDDPRGARRVLDKTTVVDPWPFSRDCIIAGANTNIILVNSQGQSEVIYQSAYPCHELRPIMKRDREFVISPRTVPGATTGKLILDDIYKGRNMTGIKRGDIKKLLILESLPKPVNFDGGPDLTSWLGTFTLERVLGTVPVEDDGSAAFELPANRPIFFEALDANDMSVKRMQSFTSVMPGEITSCVGCHENRSVVPGHQRDSQGLRATKRPVSKIKPYDGFPDVLDYHRDIQPLWDKYCVKCHNWQKYAGHLSLEGDLGPCWSISYYALFARLQVADGRNGFGNQPPRTIGTSASRLMKKIDGLHHDVKLSEHDSRLVWLWIESAAPYAGTYAALRNVEEQALEYGENQVFLQGNIIEQRCNICHSKQGLSSILATRWVKGDRGIIRPLAVYERRVVEHDPLARFGSDVLLNMSRPELSPIFLAPLAKGAGGWGVCGSIFKDKTDPDYVTLVATLKDAVAVRNSIPRYATPGWKPNQQYVREMKRFGVLLPDFDINTTPVDPFKIDGCYWRLLNENALMMKKKN